MTVTPPPKGQSSPSGATEGGRRSRVEGAVKAWVNQLVDLSGNNRLLGEAKKVLYACVLVVLFAACGGSGGDSDSGDGGGGPVGGDGRGATLTADDGTTVVYRGAVVQQSDSDDPANPVLSRVFVAYDLSLPDDVSGFYSRGFINSATRIELIDISHPSLESCGARSILPRYQGGQGHNSNEVLIDGPLDMTQVVCLEYLGSDFDDAELAVTAVLDSADGPERATWATVGAPMDDDALADVEASIRWMHDNLDPAERYRDGRDEWEPDVFGQETFDEYYGDGIESFDTVGEGGSTGLSSDADGGEGYSPDETITPPTLPSPPMPEKESDPEPEDVGEPAAPESPVDDGPAIDYPSVEGLVDDRASEVELVISIIDGMQRGGDDFENCETAGPAAPCVDVRGRMHSGDRNQRMVVSVRLGAPTQGHERDVWLLIENPDQTSSPWTVTDDSWMDDEGRPGWAM